MSALNHAVYASVPIAEGEIGVVGVVGVVAEEDEEDEEEEEGCTGEVTIGMSDCAPVA